MRDPLAAIQCANAGCVVIVLPVPMAVAGRLLKAGKRDWVMDTWLGEVTGCIVFGSKESCDMARSLVLRDSPKAKEPQDA